MKLECPTDEYILIREVELDGMGSPPYSRHGLSKEIIPENDSQPPMGSYFGRVLGSGRNWREGLDRIASARGCT